MLIFRVYVVMNTFVLKIRQWGFKGHVENLHEVTQQLAHLIPYLASDLPVFVVLKPDQTHTNGFNKFREK